MAGVEEICKSATMNGLDAFHKSQFLLSASFFHTLTGRVTRWMARENVNAIVFVE